MVTWQLTINSVDPQRMACFWASALGYVPQPPPPGFGSWPAWYIAAGVPDDDLAGLPDDYFDRIADPAGHGPKIWFQVVDELPAGRHRFHLDIYVANREVSVAERVPLIDARVLELEAAGATVEARFDERPTHYHVTMLDPEGNVFCVA